MADWDVNRPRSFMALVMDLLSGTKPDVLKADEYGRNYFPLESPADTEARVKVEEES